MITTLRGSLSRNNAPKNNYDVVQNHDASMKNPFIFSNEFYSMCESNSILRSEPIFEAASKCVSNDFNNTIPYISVQLVMRATCPLLVPTLTVTVDANMCRNHNSY